MKQFSLVKAIMIVSSLHLFVILWLVVFDDTTVDLRPNQRLTVQTVTISPKNEPLAMSSTDPINDKTTPTTPKPAPLPTPTTPKSSSGPKRVEQKARQEQPARKTAPTHQTQPARKTEPTRQTEPSKKSESDKKPQTLAADPRKKELLAQAQASIAKIQQNRTAFNVEGGDKASGTPGYRDELVSRLQMMLKLPERGEVRIKLTLSKTGKFVKLEILSPSGGLNRKYVENSLPSIQFPAFGRELGNAIESSFNITLSSEI